MSTNTQLLRNDGGISLTKLSEDRIFNFSKSLKENHISLGEVCDLFEETGIECYNELERKNIIERKKFKVCLILEKLNKHIDEIRTFWPNRSSCEYLIGFNINKCNVESMAGSISKGFEDKVQHLYSKRQLSDDGSECYYIEEESEVDDMSDTDFVYSSDERVNKKSDTDLAPSSDKKDDHSKSVCIKNDLNEVEKIPQGKTNSIFDAFKDEVFFISNKLLCKYNQYLYKYPPNSEKLVTGPWSEVEKRLFLEVVKLYMKKTDSLDCFWGFFSLRIPGRVGYQCANFYRKLVMAGEIKDPAYSVTKDKRLIYRTKKKKSIKFYQTKGHVSEECYNSLMLNKDIRDLVLFVTDCAIKQICYEDTIELSMDYEQVEKRLSRYESWALENPIKGVMDEITEELIRVPAMSPDGYVLDYRTWMKLLEIKQEDPFTRNPCEKKQIEVITNRNYHELKKKMKNVNLL